MSPYYRELKDLNYMSEDENTSMFTEDILGLYVEVSVVKYKKCVMPHDGDGDGDVELQKTESEYG